MPSTLYDTSAPGRPVFDGLVAWQARHQREDTARSDAAVAGPDLTTQQNAALVKESADATGRLVRHFCL